MKERPILFSGPMVRAILEDRKGQTRRVIKPQPEYAQRDGSLLRLEEIDSRLWPTAIDRLLPSCPYGATGDRLWVRETWHLWGPPGHQVVDYAATCPDADQLRWKPSIHMPRAYSRILLDVVGVRVERVQDISEADEIAEGVQPFREDAPDELPPGTKFRAFSALWDSINEARGYGWQANPWVWVVEFQRVSP